MSHPHDPDPAAAGDEPTHADHTVDALCQLDREMLAQLDRAVRLSETSSFAVIERVNELRGLSGRLMDYLHRAHAHSELIQGEIDRNSATIAELSGFIRQLPQQNQAEHEFLAHLDAELGTLAALAAAPAEHAATLQARIAALQEDVRARSGARWSRRMQSNETESRRLEGLTEQLEDGVFDMRQFYAMLLTAITEHTTALDEGITGLLDTAQYQDVVKQIVDRLGPAVSDRHSLLREMARLLQLLPRLAAGQTRLPVDDTLAGLAEQAARLVADYLDNEAQHRTPEADDEDEPGEQSLRIELF